MQLTDEQAKVFKGGKISVTLRGVPEFSNKKIEDIFVERGFLRVRFEGSNGLNYEAFLQLFVIIEEKKGKLSMECSIMGEKRVIRNIGF